MTRFPIRLRVLAGMSAGAGVVMALALMGHHPVPRTAGAHPEQPKPTAESAAAAGLRFAQVLAVDGVLHPAVFGVRLRSVAAPGSLGRLRATFAAGAAEVRSLIGGRTGVLRVAPLGYRVNTLAGHEAVVTVWLVALVGGAQLKPIAQWRVLTLDLAWTRRGWRVTDGHGGRGPSPLSPLPLLTVEAASFRELRHVP